MMLSDAPRYVGDRKDKGRLSAKSAEDEADGVANFFRSQLK